MIFYYLTCIIWVYSSLCQAFIFTGNSAYGIFAAIAVPLNLPHRNVFVSYNFEANYNLPGDAQTIIPGPYQRFTPIEEMVVGPTDTGGDDDSNQDAESSRKQSNLVTLTPGVKESEKKKRRNTQKLKRNQKKQKPLITRRAIYRIFRDKLKISGFEGEPCLLKLICEVNASLIGASNGVLGSILHILLTPSTSSYEGIPKKYYEAEKKGVHGDCFHYEEMCPDKILDLISATVDDIMYNKL